MTRLYHEIEDTVYFWFGANDTSGTGGDGATPLADVRLAGAAAGASPTLSPTPILLSHGDFPAGAHEIAVAATAANGFAADSTYAVFSALTIDTQNPTGFVGSFTLSPVLSNPWDELQDDHLIFGTFGHKMKGLVVYTGRVDGTPSDQNFDTDGFVETEGGQLNGATLVMTSGINEGQHRIITQFTAANQNCAFDNSWVVQPAANDEFVILGQSSGMTDRAIISSTLGQAQVDVTRVNGDLISDLIAGRVDASVGAMAAGTVTAAAIATDAIDDDAIATGAIASTAFAAGAINAAAIATDAIGAAELAADAAVEIADAILERDIDQVETTMALHSLGTAILKAVSRIRDNAGTLEVFRTDGSTLHLSQTVTTDASADPVDELTVGT
jgi:hypothetical protein